jgi:sporulation protein YlmC with PRC-barrel domain
MRQYRARQAAALACIWSNPQSPPRPAGTPSRGDALISQRTADVTRRGGSSLHFVNRSKEVSMLKRLMITTALSGLMIGSAVAQSSAPGGTPGSSQPGASMPAPSGSSATTHPGSGKAEFISNQSADQFVSSNFVGVEVIGSDDQKIGDVSDILFDKQGKVLGYVVGVGGFLGIGKKNVALPPSAFQIMPANSTTARSTTTGSASGSANSMSASSASNPADNVKLKLSMTKDELQNAPDFKTQKQQASEASRASSGAATSGMGSRPSTNR